MATIVTLLRNQLGGPGTPYNDESVTILDAGIYDGERVVVESGTQKFPEFFITQY